MQDWMHHYVQKQQKPKPAFGFSEQVRATPDLADKECQDTTFRKEEAVASSGNASKLAQPELKFQ